MCHTLSLELTGIEPATFRMRSGRSATELQPHVLLAIMLKSHIQHVPTANRTFCHSLNYQLPTDPPILAIMLHLHRHSTIQLHPTKASSRHGRLVERDRLQLWTLDLAFPSNDKKRGERLPGALAGASAVAEPEARGGAAMPHAGGQGHGVVVVVHLRESASTAIALRSHAGGRRRR